MPLNYPAARQLLETEFLAIEERVLSNAPIPPIEAELSAACDALFASETMAFREALLGSALAFLQDQTIDLTKPYMNHGDGAYNARTFDQMSVNPFLQEKRIPSTKGPFLSKFRRSIRFDDSLHTGTKDRTACHGFLACLAAIPDLATRGELLAFIRHLLFRFATAREASDVPINRIQRFSFDQYDSLTARLLSAKSGGRFPLLIVVAALTALKESLHAAWTIEWQEINVADSPSGAVGDVTLKVGSDVLLAAEITERIVDHGRLVATFNSKIAPSAMRDYLFFTTQDPPSDTHAQANRYFAQGHEISFLDIREWVRNILGVMGSDGRTVFNNTIVTLMENFRVPQAVKAAWNEAVDHVIGGSLPVDEAGRIHDDADD
jgi:hypothetical protein